MDICDYCDIPLLTSINPEDNIDTVSLIFLIIPTLVNYSQFEEQYRIILHHWQLINHHRN